MRTSTLTILAVAAASAVGLTACGSGSSLTTGSLIGGPSTQGPKPITASDRALHVGSNVARAQRCGFFFDPDQVRASFLAAEQQAGTAPDVLQKVQKEFDFTRQSVLTAAAKDDAYCTEGRTREVKAALTRHLAGNFNPPQARQDVQIGLFDHQKRDQPFDGNKVFDASQKRAGPIGGDH